MFSELVDQIVDDAARPDRRRSVAAFVNETCREISRMHDFDADGCEETIIAAEEGPTLWTPLYGLTCFKRFEYVSYDGNRNCSPKYVRPSARSCAFKNYVYRAGGGFAFVGACRRIDIYFFRFQPYLKYYPENERELTLEDCSHVTFADGAPATEAQTDKYTNWMLARHRQVIYDGAMAKLLRLTRDPRQPLFYSAYKEGRKELIAAEGTDELLARDQLRSFG